MIASTARLRELFPYALPGYLAALDNERLLAEHGLDQPITFAMFLAQAAHECGELTIVEENGNYSAERLLEIFPVTDPGTAYRRFTPAQARAYAHKPKAILSRVYARKDLGNGSEASGDGWRYRGRGPMQTTGKDNYRRMGARLGADLVANPDLLATDFALGWKAAMLEWSALDLGRIARELGPTHEALLKISRGINLGNVNSSAQPNGFTDRKEQFDKIWKALGDGAPLRLDPAADGILEEGETGSPVRELQEALIRLGYAVGEPDGTFGPRTVSAAAAFQVREPDLVGEAQSIFGLPLVPPGKWSVHWTPLLDRAKPFDDAGRQAVTAKDLAAKGDGVVGLLLWIRRGIAGAAAYLGLDTAADKAGVQLPQNLIDLRKVVDPLASSLQWLTASKQVLLIALLIGAGVLVSRGIAELVERYRKPFRTPGAQ